MLRSADRNGRDAGEKDGRAVGAGDDDTKTGAVTDAHVSSAQAIVTVYSVSSEFAGITVTPWPSLGVTKLSATVPSRNAAVTLTFAHASGAPE